MWQCQARTPGVPASSPPPIMVLPTMSVGHANMKVIPSDRAAHRCIFHDLTRTVRHFLPQYYQVDSDGVYVSGGYCSHDCYGPVPTGNA